MAPVFPSIAAEARLQLKTATALLRRYIHVIAAEPTLPEPRPVGVSRKPSNETPRKLQRRREALFCLIDETCSARHAAKSDGADTPFVQWALMMEAARRLARLLRRQKGRILKDLPIPSHILRRLPPRIDALLCRLDEAARPEAWAGITAQGPPVLCG